ELEIQRVPELESRVELVASVPLEAAARCGGVDEAALGERPRREDIGGELAERAAQEARLGRDEAELVTALPHLGRQQVGERAAQHRLRLAASDQLVAGKGERELYEPVVEERHARLDAVRHRVAVLVPEEL